MAKAHGSALQDTWSDTTEYFSSLDLSHGNYLNLASKWLDHSLKKTDHFKLRLVLHVACCRTNDTQLKISTVDPSEPRRPLMTPTSLRFWNTWNTSLWVIIASLRPFPPAEYEDYTGVWKASDWYSDFVIVQSKIDGLDNRSDYIIIGDALSAMMARWIEDLSNDLSDSREPPFSIHHPDLSVDNIFADEQFNITCVIDWAFNFSVPLSMLFTAPGLS